jgi:uncharacterized membrane protein YecN with MAPEG domain
MREEGGTLVTGCICWLGCASEYVKAGVIVVISVSVRGTQAVMIFVRFKRLSGFI